MLDIISTSLNDISAAENRAEQVSDQDTGPIDQLMTYLGNGTLSVAQLMERLNLSHRPTFRKNYLNPALEKKLIKRTVPYRPNSRNQKYRKCKK